MPRTHVELERDVMRALQLRYRAALQLVGESTVAERYELLWFVLYGTEEIDAAVASEMAAASVPNAVCTEPSPVQVDRRDTKRVGGVARASVRPPDRSREVLHR